MGSTICFSTKHLPRYVNEFCHRQNDHAPDYMAATAKDKEVDG